MSPDSLWTEELLLLIKMHLHQLSEHLLKHQLHTDTWRSWTDENMFRYSHSNSWACSVCVVTLKVSQSVSAALWSLWWRWLVLFHVTVSPEGVQPSSSEPQLVLQFGLIPENTWTPAVTPGVNTPRCVTLSHYGHFFSPSELLELHFPCSLCVWRFVWQNSANCF